MPPPAHIRLGLQGEQAAAEYLVGLGWTILERNWRCRYGELDLIAQDGVELVIVEVKSRRSTDPAAAFEQVHRRKQALLVRAAEEYLAACGLPDPAWRIDVIAVVFGGSAPVIEHAQDALLW